MENRRPLCRRGPDRTGRGRGGVEADAAVSGAVRSAGSPAICLWAAVRSGCAVADGAFHASLYGHSHPWDIAATTLLVREAGGFVGRIDGAPIHAAGPSGRWLAAATPELWDTVAGIWSKSLESLDR